MSDARWNDPREYGERDGGDERPRVYDERDRDDHDSRDGLMYDVDLPRGEERALVVDRDRVYELNGEDSRTLAAVGTFRVVPDRTSTPTTIRSATSSMKALLRPSILAGTNAA